MGVSPMFGAQHQEVLGLRPKHGRDAHATGFPNLVSQWVGVLSALACVMHAGCADAPGPKTLPAPVTFRDRLSRLVGEGKLVEARQVLLDTDPVFLARAASERADIRYLVVMGIGPMTPGIPPRSAGAPPIRTWVMPGTSDVRVSKEDERYQVAAYEFAKAYNIALAAEEKGVR